MDALIRLRPRRAGERGDARVEREYAAHENVDAELRIAHDRALDAVRLAVEQQPRQADAVAADVVQRATAGLDDVADVARVVVEVPEPALDGGEPADPAGGNELAHFLPGRMEAIHERFGQL